MGGAQVEQHVTLRSKSRLPDDDTLVLAVNHHVSVHMVSQSVDVGGVLILSLEDKEDRGSIINNQ